MTMIYNKISQLLDKFLYSAILSTIVHTNKIHEKWNSSPPKNTEEHLDRSRQASEERQLRLPLSGVSMSRYFQRF